MHGNIEAFRAVLDFYRRNGVDEFVCCGDLVGYGPDPLACVELAQELKALHIVMGNHDGAVVGRMDVKWFNDNAAAAIVYARANLTGKAFAYLAALPERVETGCFTLVHGSPRKPLTEYLLSESQFMDNASAWTVSPCFIGHSHMPLYFHAPEGGLPETDFLKPGIRLSTAAGRVMINPGSVGQPRDGDPRAACGIFDPVKNTFELYRVFYDVEVTQKKMAAGKLPAMLADRLSFGF